MKLAFHKKRHLSTFFTLVFLVFIVLPLIILAVFVFIKMKRSLETIAQENVTACANQTAGTLYETLDQLQNLTVDLMLSEPVHDFMDPHEPADVIRATKTTFEINRMISFTSLKYHSILKNLFFVRGDGEIIYSYERAASAEEARSIREIYHAAGDFRSTRAFWYAPDATPYFIVDYTDSKTYETFGTILIQLDLAEISEFSRIHTIYPDSYALLSHGGQILFRDREEPAAFLPHGTDSTARETMELDGVRYAYYHGPLRQSSIRYHVLIPVSSVLYRTNQTFEYFVLIAAALFILLAVMGAFVFRRMLHPLSEVSDSLKKMAEGNLSVRMLPTPYLETDNICSSFNTMAMRLDDMLHEVYEKGLLLKQAELDLLQSQMSPHFLFNVLESINMRCAQTGDRTVGELVVALSELLRSNLLLKDQPKISIEQELSYIRTYLYIQKMRFEDKLTYSIELEAPCISRCRIPKLTIQPLVENAVVHGLENRCGGGHVSVRIWEEDCLYIRVSDNGVGFDPAAPRPDGKGNHIALLNLQKRIALYYGEGYGLTLKSQPGTGTEALLTLPVDTEEGRTC